MNDDDSYLSHNSKVQKVYLYNLFWKETGKIIHLIVHPSSLKVFWINFKKLLMRIEKSLIGE